MGFLCSDKEQVGRDGRKWCNVDEKYALRYADQQPHHSAVQGYWDYVDENDKSVFGFCLKESNSKSAESDDSGFGQKRASVQKCGVTDVQLTSKYFLAALISLFVTPVVASGHVSQTIQVYSMSDVNILTYLSTKFKKLVDLAAKMNLLTPDAVREMIQTTESTIKQMQQDMQNAQAPRTRQKQRLGQFIKDLFATSIKLIAEVSPHQSTQVMQFIVDFVPDEHVMECIKGGNFVVHDGGAIYEHSKTQMDGFGRFSSHAKNASDVVQMGNTDIFMDTYLHLLTGTFTYKSGETVSWFQMEGAPMPPGMTTPEVFSNIVRGAAGLDFRFLTEYVDHFTDSTIYFFIKANSIVLGTQSVNLAIGTSHHTDTNPIYVFPRDELFVTQMDANMVDQNYTTTFTSLNNAYTQGLKMAINLQQKNHLFSENRTIAENATRPQTTAVVPYSAQPQSHTPFPDILSTPALVMQQALPTGNLNGAGRSKQKPSRIKRTQKRRVNRTGQNRTRTRTCKQTKRSRAKKANPNKRSQKNPVQKEKRKNKQKPKSKKANTQKRKNAKN